MSLAWLRSAHEKRLAIAAAGGPMINIDVDTTGVSIWCAGEWSLRTWEDLERATMDPLTVTVESLARRLQRRAA